MIVNAPAVLALLLAAMELVAGAALVAAALRGLLAPSRAGAEPLRPLSLLLVLLVASLAASSLLLWALLLRSLVPQWADVRCVVGVLRVGADARGVASWLPGLGTATTLLRAALLPAAAACAALHVATRDRPEGGLGRGHLRLLAVAGLLAIAAALAESAWIAIPKGASDLSSGCCMAFPAAVAGPATDAAPVRGPWTLAMIFGVHAVGFAVWIPLFARARGATWEVLRLASAVGVLYAGLRFAGDVVAPVRLGLPLHRCLWCLVGEAPETLVGIALLAAQLVAAAARVAVARLGPGEGPETDRMLRVLDRSAIVGLLGGLAFFASQRLAS